MSTAHAWAVADRPTLWLDWTGDLAATLEAARRASARRVMLTGPRPPAGWLFGAQPPGWAPGSHYLDASLPVARFTHTDTGQRVDVRRAAEWFGDTPLTADEARAAWGLLLHHYRRTFPTGALFDSPGATGVNGWLQSGGQWAQQLEPDDAELIRSTSPQHRVELFAHDGQAPGFVYIDGRWQYAALTRELGQAPARWLTAAAAEDHARASRLMDRTRYHVTAAVPAGWDTLGVLMTKAGPDASDGWRAPRHPSEEFRTWCDAAELRLAVACGWRIRYHEALTLTKGRPLDTWTTRLKRLRQTIIAEGPPTIATTAAAAAVRAILLHGIGSFHSTGRDVVRVVNPMTYKGDAQLEARGDVYVVREREALTGRWATLAHPEYSSQVWARSHARLLESPTGTSGVWAGALQVDFEHLIGVRGDALYLTYDPHWPDDGAPGRLRVKGRLPGPIPYPTTMGELNALRKATEAAT